MEDSLKIISPVPEEFFDEIVYHLRNNFFADEPLNKAVRLCDQGEKHEDLELHSLLTLKDNLSVMAIDKRTNRVNACFLKFDPTPNTTPYHVHIDM